MRQLSGIDTAFLQMETPTTYAQVASVAVFASAPGGQRMTLVELRRLLDARIHRAPILRQRLLTVPWDLERPYWVDDTDFSVDRHLRESTLPEPGDDRRLAQHVARLVARPLDRSRPLWELHLVHGLADGRFALIGMVHHAAADGVMGRDLLTTLLDLEPSPPPDPAPPPWRPQPAPGVPTRLLRSAIGLAGQPLRVAAAQQRLAGHALARFVGSGVEAVLWKPRRLQEASAFEASFASPATWMTPPSALVAPAPRAPFNRSVTGRRAWAFASLPRDRVRQLRQVTGTSANEVLLAVAAGALRRWLTDHGGVPSRPLRALVPVSTRPGGPSRGSSGDGADGNAVSFIVTDLWTEQADPERRLQEVARSAREARRAHERDDVAAHLVGFSDLAVPGLAAVAARLANAARLTDWTEPAVNLVISSVPGPTFPLYLRGARLLAAYPASVVTDGFGLNVTVLATEHSHDVGLTACPELVPDLWQLAAAFEPSLDELLAAGPPS